MIAVSPLVACLPLAEFALPDWLKSAWSLLLVVLGFSLVVFVHELGHFLAAKWAKVRVDKFCIGFGPELFGFTWGETRYGFNILPLGGYVKMLGQEDFAVDKSGELKVKDEQGSFTNKTVGQRMVIVSAGVIMNLVFAAVGMMILMMVGTQTAPSVVGAVAAGTPASRAGLRSGDRILAINGDPMNTFEDVMMRIVLSDPGEVLEFDVQRDGKLVSPRPRVLPEFKEEQQVRQVGLSPGWSKTVMVVFGPPDARYADNELQPNDRLVAVVNGDQRTEIRSMGDATDALSRASGGQVTFEVVRPASPSKEGERFDPSSEDTPGKSLTVRTRSQWYAQTEKTGDPLSASLLGLLPRMKAGIVEPKGAADLADVKLGDTIVSLGGTEYPNAVEFSKLIEASDDRDITLVVRRPRAANPKAGLSADAVRFVIKVREALLEAARQDLKSAHELVHALVSESGLPHQDKTAIFQAAANAKSPADWLKWLEGADQHTLTLRPKRKWKLFGATQAQIGMTKDLPEDDRLFIADIAEKIGDRPSPAAVAKIPRGAVILRVDGSPVESWGDLTEALRAAAGRDARVDFRVGLDYRTAAFPVPDSIVTALKLPVGARIQSIAGADKIEVAGGDQLRTYFLPDWQAVRELLRKNAGKTVPVKWTDADGQSHEAPFAATEAGIDPWPMRIGYMPQFFCYPMTMPLRITNPIKALAYGIKKTYYFTWQVLQSIRHIAFTRQVGIEKVSGPVGIARIGMVAAEMDWTSLLLFLCMISANLAVINALPMPIVDGGLFFFLLLEKIRGEPVSLKTQAATQLIGIVLIAGVFLLVTLQDIINWK